MPCSIRRISSLRTKRASCQQPLPGLGASGEATGDVSPLIAALQEATPQDGFLSEVLKSVQDSCEASWRDFSFDASTKLVYYQRAGDPMPRICVPASCRGDIMREAHGGNVLAGHPGIARTTAQVARFYYWPGLHADVAHFVRTCITCAAVKPSTQLRLGSEEHAFSTAPSQPFTALVYGLDWAHAFVAHGKRVDCDLGGSYN